MAKFNLENYETVEDRLKKFWKDFPKGRIDSNVVHITDDGTCVTIRTEIYKDIEDTKPVTTGIAQETKGQGGFANADAWMENCETSSIGRALANWNYQGSTKPRPSREEMSKVQVEKVPVKKPTKEEQTAMEKVVDKMIEEPAKNVGEQLNKILEGMIEDESTRNKIKTDVYYELVENKLADDDINKWTEKNMDVFLTRVEDMLKNISEKTDEQKLVEDVFGDVEDNTRNCPDCGDAQWIEDNREKKASNPEKFGAIPSWTCSTYQDNQGCGWKAWNDTDCPKEWL